MLSDAIKSQLSIIDYARDIGYTPIRISSRYYTIKEMDSIRINVEKGLWYRNSLVGQRNDINTRGQMGGSVIDFAAYFDPDGFVPDGVRSKTVSGEAMFALAERYGIVDDGYYRIYNTGARFNQTTATRPRPDTTPRFTQPSEVSEAKTGIYDVPKDLSGENKVKDYLVRVRGVSANIVQRFINEDMLYQSKPNRNGFSNCVFVSPNNSFVCEHGATEGGRFVRTLSGSDMKELFFYNPDKNDNSNKEKTLVVTESVIDMMSVMTQFEREGRSLDDYKFLALAGVTNLGTRSDPKSLEYHLRKPENVNINRVMLALDNDDAGLKGIDDARDILLSTFDYDEQDVITYLAPQGKDWNDYIKLNLPTQPTEQEQSHQTSNTPPVIADVDIVLLFEGEYETILSMQNEFWEKQKEWSFADYIHPHSDTEHTVLTCEIFDDERIATNLLALAEKYNVVVSRINRDELQEMYEEENRRETEESLIRAISDNPLNVDRDFEVSHGESVQQEQEREVVEPRQEREEETVEITDPIDGQEAPQEVAEPVPQRKQEVEEEKKEFKGVVYINGTNFQGDVAETTFILNEGIRSEDVLKLIEYNTGFYEEVVRGLKAIGKEVVFYDGEGVRTSGGQREYDELVEEGRETFELQVTDMDSGEYNLTIYNDEKGGVPFGELELDKNYVRQHGTITYENAVGGALDLQVGDIIVYLSHECTIENIEPHLIDMVDNDSGKKYSIKSFARGNKDKEWDEILESRGYSFIAHETDRYAIERANQEESMPKREEETIEITDPIDKQPLQQEVSAPMEQSEQEQVSAVNENIVITNTNIYSDEELSSLRESADLSILNVNYRDKAISSEDKLKYALENGLKKVLNAEEFKNWLSTRNTNTAVGLSVSNSLRVFAQNPTAQYTATYDRWHYFGRQVAKGAQALLISRPIIPKEADMIKKAQSIHSNLQSQIKSGSDKAAVALFPNSSVTFSMNRQGTMDVSVSGKSIKMLPDYQSLELFIKKRLSECPERYTIAHHFDVRDTIVPETLWVRKDRGDYTEKEVVKDKDGKPHTKTVRGVTTVEIVNTPERQARFQPFMEGVISPHDKEKMEVLYSVCKTLSENTHGVPVYERTKSNDEHLKGANGYYCRESTIEHPNGYIVLDANMDITEKCSVLLHEISHSELHREPEKLRTEMGVSRLDTAMKEVQAEAVAYSVGNQFGLETDTSSFKYLAAFTSGFDMRQLTASMNVIAKETAKLTGELTTILDEKGYNLDLSQKSFEIDYKSLSVEAMSIASLANDKCTSALQELPKMMEEYSRDTEIVTTLKDQYNAYSSQLAMVNSVYDLVEQLNEATTAQDREIIANQLSDTMTSISISQETCKTLDEKFVEQADKVKGQLRSDFEVDGLSTLKAMAHNYPALALLSDMQLKYIAESKYISSTFGRLLKTDPKLFVDKVVERAQQLPLVAAKNGAFVEIRKCEQFTNPPFFSNGTLCSPAVANSIFTAAEDKSAEIIMQAEEHQESFPTTRCDYTIYVPIGNELKSFTTSIEIGSGEQRDLADNITQFCDQPYKEAMLSACQERPLSRCLYVPKVAQASVEVEHSVVDKGNKKISEVVKTYTDMSEAIKKKQMENNTKDHPTKPSAQKNDRTDK